ncbi:hypothetical protein EGT86_11750 [Burkholderia pseudomallei]|nr:hypothetical protein EGT86_11750 [Burkholderia pseudomallei]
MLMAFLFARMGTALAMRVEDVFVQDRRLWVRGSEKGGKAHAMPCYHTLEAYLHAYLEETGIIAAEPKGPLFRTIARGTGQLSTTPLPQANAYTIVRGRALAAPASPGGSATTSPARQASPPILKNCRLESAAAMANHTSTRTTQLYDPRGGDISRDEVERNCV